MPPGLRYVDDGMPGLRRERAADGFVYLDAAGRTVRDPEILDRIRLLVVPPAWTDVWICADPKGHIQATARDARGRKQYRYHERWREVRDATKFERMQAFGHALCAIRARVECDLARPGMCRDKLLATVIRLLDTTLIRVGNIEYARENGSFGLTTLRPRHVSVRGGEIRFRFRGKSGVPHDVAVQDPRLARIVRRCMDLPGQQLFAWVDDDGTLHPVESADVNAWLQEVTGADFTAKDYRTWAGSALALQQLRAANWESATQAKREAAAVIRTVAARLGNTPAVCRRCYVHPAVLDAWLDGSLGAATITPLRRPGLRPEERALLAFLRDRQQRRVSRKRPAAVVADFRAAAAG